MKPALAGIRLLNRMLKPLSSDRWNYVTAAHLLNRAGFGGSPVEIQKLADLGLDNAVAHLLDYEKIPDPTPNPEWAKPNPEEVAKYREAVRNGTPEQKQQAIREEQQLAQRRMLELRGWWLQRMTHGPRPFSGKDGVVLARPFCHERGQSEESVFHVAAKRLVPPRGHRQLAAVVVGCRPGPGHAYLAGSSAE